MSDSETTEHLKVLKAKMRLLYVSQSPDSQEARKILEDEGFDYIPQEVPDRKEDTRDDPKPPCLITGEGRFSGVAQIRSYIRHMLWRWSRTPLADSDLEYIRGENQQMLNSRDNTSE